MSRQKKPKEKNSSIIYHDLWHTVKELTNEEAGEFFKRILGHLNGSDLPASKYIELLFGPVKRQFERDSEAWEAEKAYKSRGGQKSAEQRALLRTQEKLFVDETVYSVEHSSTVRKSVEKKSTEPSVNVTVTVPVTVTENINTAKRLIETQREILLDELRSKHSEIDFDFAFEQWSLSIEADENFVYKGTPEQSKALFNSLTKWINTWNRNEQKQKLKENGQKHTNTTSNRGTTGDLQQFING